MNNAAPFVRIPVHPVHGDDLTWIVEDIRPIGQQGSAPVREHSNQHRHRVGGARNPNYVDCPVCGEKVKKSNNIAYATCRLPEGCGHMFCCHCLVDYLPIMREGNHQHRAGCRHYQPLGLVDAPPAYAIQPVQNHFGRDLGRAQVTTHPVAQELRPLSVLNENTPGLISRAIGWMKRVLFMILICYVSSVFLIGLIVINGNCECQLPVSSERLTFPPPSGRFSN